MKSWGSLSDQAQPRRVSGVGWSAGLGGWLAAVSDILCGLTESLSWYCFRISM